MKYFLETFSQDIVLFDVKCYQIKEKFKIFTSIRNS